MAPDDLLRKGGAGMLLPSLVAGHLEAYHSVVQRLFTMFPAGAAGFGLVALRISVLGTLLFDGAYHRHAISPWASFGLAITALLLCLGLLTPYCAVICALFESLLLFRDGTEHQLHLALDITNAVVLALLGPGAYSMDALIFGRKRLRLPPRL